MDTECQSYIKPIHTVFALFHFRFFFSICITKEYSHLCVFYIAGLSVRFGISQIVLNSQCYVFNERSKQMTTLLFNVVFYVVSFCFCFNHQLAIIIETLIKIHQRTNSVIKIRIYIIFVITLTLIRILTIKVIGYSKHHVISKCEVNLAQ